MLTVPEIRVLYGGFRAQQQVEQDERNGVKPEHREELSQFNKQLQNNE